MIEAWAEKLAVSIKKANETETVSVSVMKYALIILINFLIPYTSALLIGLGSGKPTETAFSVFSLILVRAVSGGYHFNSPVICTIVTTIAAAVPPHIPFPSEWNVYATGLCFILFAIYAPANLKGYARMPEKYFLLMKIASLLIVGSNFIFNSSFLSIVFLLQAISLLFRNKEVRT